MQARQSIDINEVLAESAVKYQHDPSGFIRYAFPWGEKGTPLEKWEGQKKWQQEVSDVISSHLQNPDTRHQPLKIAVASGHGIGKSAYLGMVHEWARTTYVDTRVRITANTDGQLKATTVPELRKWFNLSIFNHWFDFQATSVRSVEHDHRSSWRTDMIPWSANNPAAFAGLHNAQKRIIIILDEASGIDEVIWETLEGALTDAKTEIIWLAFGNPLDNQGRFRECWRKYSKEWITFNIDSREVEGTNVEMMNETIESRGIDSDYVRSRILGQFPYQSAKQFYPTDLVEACQGRHLKPEQYNFAPVILSCDSAWEGDDLLVIGVRQGLTYRILEKIPKNSNDMLIAQKIAKYEKDLNADAVFIDGGFGTGIISGGRTMGLHWTIVWFGANSGRADCKNKRSEMLANVLDWMKEGGSFEEDQELYEELLALETGSDISGKLLFPQKEITKKTLGRSPNCLDNLALTFAYPVHRRKEQNRDTKPYDPMDRA